MSISAGFTISSTSTKDIQAKHPAASLMSSSSASSAMQGEEHLASSHDIQASINDLLLSAGIAFKGVNVPIIFDAPDRVHSQFPAIAIHHHAVEATPIYLADNVSKDNQGRVVKGYEYAALLEWNIWVTRRDRDWQVQLTQLNDLVMRTIINNRRVQVNKYTGNTITRYSELPDYEKTVILLGDIREAISVLPDPNIDLERKRMLASYQGILT